jgi:hypothetical protein
MKRVALCVTIWWALIISGHAEAVPASCPTNLSTSAPATGGSVGGNNVPINVNTNPPPPGLVTTPLTEPEPGLTGEGGTPGGYQAGPDPGMGGETPSIPGAAGAGGTFQGGAPWGPGQEPPTEPTEPGQPQGPYGTGPPTGPGQPGATGPQPPPGGYQCGYPGYPPCPPGYSPPYDPSGEPPWWQGLIPPEEPGKPTPPMGGPGPGGCPPPCHIKPGTNQCHC